ncbi:unnamed protein product [Lathyrus oleraceus]
MVCLTLTYIHNGYRHDRLRHERVSQHTSVRREKSQQVSKALSPFGQEEPSTYGDRASPHATPSSFSRRRHDSPFEASLPSSSRMRQVSPVPPPTDDVADSVSPPISPPNDDDDDVDPVPALEGEGVAADAEPEAFGGSPVDLSLLPLYSDHTSKHTWDGEERGLQKFLNHGRKIVALSQPNEEWFIMFCPYLA